jgi:hypothetical protein
MSAVSGPIGRALAESLRAVPDRPEDAGARALARRLARVVRVREPEVIVERGEGVAHAVHSAERDREVVRGARALDDRVGARKGVDRLVPALRRRGRDALLEELACFVRVLSLGRPPRCEYGCEHERDRSRDAARAQSLDHHWFDIPGSDC